MSDEEDICVFPTKVVAESAAAKFDFRKLFRSSSPNSDDESGGKASAGFRVRVPVNEEEFEAPTFDRIRYGGMSGFVRPLPELPDLATLTGFGRINRMHLRSLSDECVIHAPNINFPNQLDSEKESESEEERINRIKEVQEFAENLQRQCSKLYENENVPGEFEKQSIKAPVVKFAKFAIDDYSPESYNYIWAILLDIKGFFKQIGDEDNTNVLLNVMKLLRSKYIRENITACGAGGFELYETTPL